MGHTHTRTHNTHTHTHTRVAGQVRGCGAASEHPVGHVLPRGQGPQIRPLLSNADTLPARRLLARFVRMCMACTCIRACICACDRCSAKQIPCLHVDYWLGLYVCACRVHAFMRAYVRVTAAQQFRYPVCKAATGQVCTHVHTVCLHSCVCVCMCPCIRLSMYTCVCMCSTCTCMLPARRAVLIS